MIMIMMIYHDDDDNDDENDDENDYELGCFI